jgi:hypothetical protein
VIAAKYSSERLNSIATARSACPLVRLGRCSDTR